MPKNRQFEEVFSECLERLLSSSETVQQCLERYPEHSAELEPLLHTAMSVNHALDIKPSAEMKARVRYQLQLKMAEAGRPRQGFALSWHPRWALVTTSVLLVFMLGGGTVLASGASIPGQPLYPVKIATENVRIKLAGSDSDKAELLASFRDHRVDEINRLMQSGKPDPEKVEAVSRRYISNMVQANNLPALARNGNGEAQTMLAQEAVPPPTSFAATAPASQPEKPREDRGEEEKQPLTVTSAPPEAQPSKPAKAGVQAPKTATQATPEAAKQATAAREQTAEKQAETQKNTLTPEQIERLKKDIIRQGITHPQQLEKWLESEKVPEQYKPAIRRMVQEARQSFQETLEKLERKQAQAEKNR